MATESRDAVVTLTFSELEEFAAPGRDYDLVLLAQAGEAGVHAMGHVIITRLRQAASELEQNPSEQNERIVEVIQGRIQPLQVHCFRVNSPFIVGLDAEYAMIVASNCDAAAHRPSTLRLWVTFISAPFTCLLPAMFSPQMYQKDLQYLRHVPKIMVSQRREFGISAASYSEGLAGTPDEASLFFVTMVEDPETFRLVVTRFLCRHVMKDPAMCWRVVGRFL